MQRIVALRMLRIHEIQEPDRVALTAEIGCQHSVKLALGIGHNKAAVGAAEIGNDIASRLSAAAAAGRMILVIVQKTKSNDSIVFLSFMFKYPPSIDIFYGLSVLGHCLK